MGIFDFLGKVATSAQKMAEQKQREMNHFSKKRNIRHTARKNERNG